MRHLSVPPRSKMILVETQNFENIASLASQDWWMISSSCQFTEFKIKLTLGKLFFTKINDFRCCFSILMMAFFPSTYLLHSFRIIFMALIYFAYKVLTFQFGKIFFMNGNKSSGFFLTSNLRELLRTEKNSGWDFWTFGLGQISPFEDSTQGPGL